MSGVSLRKSIGSASPHTITDRPDKTRRPASCDLASEKNVTGSPSLTSSRIEDKKTYGHSESFARGGVFLPAVQRGRAMKPKEQGPASGFIARCLSLTAVGGLTTCVYILTLVFYVGGPQSHTRPAKELFAWFCVLPLLPLFAAGYSRVKLSDDESAVRKVVIFAVVFCLAALFVYPFHSTDVFGYINRGWQQVRYGQNPYVYTTSEIPKWQQDPMIWDHWIYNPNPYGFLFTLLARALCQLGGGNWALTLLLFKSVNALAYGFIARLVWSGAKLLGHARPRLALYALLWNPLILMHHIANGHNDILVGCLLALAFYLLVRGAEVWVIPVLVAATFLKYAPALLIPLALVYIFKRRGWKVAAKGCALGALVAAAVSVPYIQDWRMFKLEDISDNAALIDNSLHSFLIHVFENVARLVPALADFHAAVNWAIKLLLRVGFVLFFVYQLARAPKNFNARQLMEKSLLVLFVLICVVSSKFNAWYMGMLLPPALLLDERHWLRRLILLISCAELLSLTFFKQAYMLNFFAMILLPCWIIFRRVREEKPLGEATAAS